MHPSTAALLPALLKGYIIMQTSIVGRFPLGRYFLELLDFQMRTVYSGSDLIWSAEFPWVWRVFLTLGLLFVVKISFYSFTKHVVKQKQLKALLYFASLAPSALSVPQVHSAWEAVTAEAGPGKEGFVLVAIVIKCLLCARPPILTVHRNTRWSAAEQ